MDDKLILQELKAIKRALTCGGSIGGSNSDTNLALDTFQIYNCSEEPVGSPQDVLKTVVLNSITTKICNVQEIAEAISTTDLATETTLLQLLTILNREYNKEEEVIITPNSTYNIPINSVHAYTINVIGNGTTSSITINGGTALQISNGYNKQMEFTTLNEYSIDIFCDVNDIIRIRKKF